MLYFILDRASDFVTLRCEATPSAHVIPIGADAITGIPSDYPSERITYLSSLISAESLASEVTYRVAQLWPTLSTLSDCPYYKVKQLLDSVIEKQVIVENLARLQGEKCYVRVSKQWVAADGDNPESCRFAALFMDTLPGFTPVIKKRQFTIGERLIRLARLVRRTWQAACNGSVYGSWTEGVALIGATGYGASKDFSNISTQSLDMGSVILATLRSGQLWNALTLLFHDAPISVNPPPAEQRHFYLTLCRKVILRSAHVQKILDRLPITSQLPKYYFTVNYGRIGDIAIVRALRKRGVPCVTMQHALVGHDTWTASQYLDFWESDFKLVANQNIVDSLASFEGARSGGTYQAVSLPMYRCRGGTPTWDAKSVLYILTGFTRANTMYDNRRINDAIYLEEVIRDLNYIKCQFNTCIRTHPYDKRQYDDSIAEYITSRLGIQHAETTNTFFKDALVIIDSPSTILADMVLSGRPVMLINRNAQLTPHFIDIATRHNVIFKSINALHEYLISTSTDIIIQNQQSFAHAFLETYCKPSDDLTVPEAIKKCLTKYSAISTAKEEACAP